ncbi:hypothetical protein QTO34_004576 [Cnephaeus nilssonii]|uniref:Amphiphysin n=1 Tax=Cnephaeus nilssonii TaxID=3371016 RepID=A0AA40HQA4_CNENI|nr:hypothetical protein QTO34_004576 [Eptesicus nilssonii]
MQEASMKLTESLHEVYEPDWYGREDVKMVGEKCDVLWEDFHQKLVDGSLLTLDTYLGQFPDIKNRIAKRSRKLVDYDSARHHLEALQSSKRKDESRISKAEEEFQKAQKVFEEFNVDLQEELPSLWSRRVGFYVNTFKNVSSLEAKFHKEIAVVSNDDYFYIWNIKRPLAHISCVHSSSDSGPLRIAKTPSPPEEPSPLPSPTASPNHTLAPASPAPARPRSPSQTRKGPPVPPLPKVTPTKELQQENIISFFEDNFVPEISVTTPSQNEVPEVKKEETLLDLDFDPFKPEVASAGSAGVTHSPMSQPMPEAEGAIVACMETEQPYDLPDSEMPAMETGGLVKESQEDLKKSEEEEEKEKTEDSMWAGVETCGKNVSTESSASPQDDGTNNSDLSEDEIANQRYGLLYQEIGADKEEIPPGTDADVTDATPVPAAEGAPAEEAEKEMEAAPPAGEGASLEEPKMETETAEVLDGDRCQPEETEAAAPQEKVIPAVIIEPASNNEEEGGHGIMTGAEPKEATEDSALPGPTSEMPEPAAEQKAPEDSQPEPSAPPASQAPQEVPPGFLYKVEALHDFEAANSDELTLQRGDVVLVVPSDSEADQDAGWLVGVKESDWLQYRDLATYKGLFPENFTQRLE